MNKKGAILKIAMATMLSKTRSAKKVAQKENERANTIQHHHHHQFGNQLTDSHLNEFQVHVRNRQNGCSCVNHLIHCTVMYRSSTLSTTLTLTLSVLPFSLFFFFSKYCFSVVVFWLLMIWFVGGEILLNQWCLNVWVRSHCPLPLSSIPVALGGLFEQQVQYDRYRKREREW